MDQHKNKLDFEAEDLKDGLGASEAYFDQMEAELLDKLSLEEALDPFSDQDGLAGSESYFEDLETQILEKLPKEKGNTKVIHLVRKNWQIAASILLILGIFGIWSVRNATEVSHPVVLEDFDRVSDSFVEQQIYFLTDAEMELLLEDESLEIDSGLEIQDTELEEYLLINEAYNYN